MSHDEAEEVLVWAKSRGAQILADAATDRLRTLGESSEATAPSFEMRLEVRVSNASVSVLSG